MVAVVVVALAVALVQPLLIVALQLIVEDDSVDPRITFLQPLCGLQVGTIDLGIVFQFARSLEAGVEALSGLAVGIPMTLEKVATLFRQDRNRVSMTGYANGFDQALFEKVPKVR